MKIEVIKKTKEELESLGVFSWPTWGCEVSEFDWTYDSQEEAYVLEGRVVVETAEGEVEFGKGDYVVFPAGLRCKWKVKESIKKYYRFV